MSPAPAQNSGENAPARGTLDSAEPYPGFVRPDDELLTSTPTPQQILAFRPSHAAQERLRWLLDANRSRPLTADEEAELNQTLAVEQFMRRLKVRALAKVQA